MAQKSQRDKAATEEPKAAKKKAKKMFDFFSTNDGKKTSEDTNAKRDVTAASLFIVMSVVQAPLQVALPPNSRALLEMENIRD